MGTLYVAYLPFVPLVNALPLCAPGDRPGKGSENAQIPCQLTLGNGQGSARRGNVPIDYIVTAAHNLTPEGVGVAQQIEVFIQSAW